MLAAGLAQPVTGAWAVTRYSIVLAAVLLGLVSWLAIVLPAPGSLAWVMGAALTPIVHVNVLDGTLAERDILVVPPLHIAVGDTGVTTGLGFTTCVSGMVLAHECAFDVAITL